jgi:hypothetical protein
MHKYVNVLNFLLDDEILKNFENTNDGERGKGKVGKGQGISTA